MTSATQCRWREVNGWFTFRSRTKADIWEFYSDLCQLKKDDRSVEWQTKVRIKRTRRYVELHRILFIELEYWRWSEWISLMDRESPHSNPIRHLTETLEWRFSISETRRDHSRFCLRDWSLHRKKNWASRLMYSIDYWLDPPTTSTRSSMCCQSTMGERNQHDEQCCSSLEQTRIKYVQFSFRLESMIISSILLIRYYWQTWWTCREWKLSTVVPCDSSGLEFGRHPSETEIRVVAQRERWNIEWEHSTINQVTRSANRDVAKGLNWLFTSCYVCLLLLTINSLVNKRRQRTSIYS